MASSVPAGAYPVQDTQFLDFYDRPISGWLRAAGRYWLFHRQQVIDETTDAEVWPDPLIFRVYDVPEALRLQALRHYRRWQFEIHRPWKRDLAANPNASPPYAEWMAFYNHPDWQAFSAERLIAASTLAGTTDLETATFATPTS